MKNRLFLSLIPFIALSVHSKEIVWQNSVNGDEYILSYPSELLTKDVEKCIENRFYKNPDLYDAKAQLKFALKSCEKTTKTNLTNFTKDPSLNSIFFITHYPNESDDNKCGSYCSNVHSLKKFLTNRS